MAEIPEPAMTRKTRNISTHLTFVTNAVPQLPEDAWPDSDSNFITIHDFIDILQTLLDRNNDTNFELLAPIFLPYLLDGNALDEMMTNFSGVVFTQAQETLSVDGKTKETKEFKFSDNPPAKDVILDVMHRIVKNLHADVDELFDNCRKIANEKFVNAMQSLSSVLKCLTKKENIKYIMARICKGLTKTFAVANIATGALALHMQNSSNGMTNDGSIHNLCRIMITTYNQVAHIDPPTDDRPQLHPFIEEVNDDLFNNCLSDMTMMCSPNIFFCFGKLCPSFVQMLFWDSERMPAPSVNDDEYKKYGLNQETPRKRICRSKQSLSSQLKQMQSLQELEKVQENPDDTSSRANLITKFEGVKASPLTLKKTDGTKRGTTTTKSTPIRSNISPRKRKSLASSSQGMAKRVFLEQDPSKITNHFSPQDKVKTDVAIVVDRVQSPKVAADVSIVGVDTVQRGANRFDPNDDEYDEDSSDDTDTGGEESIASDSIEQKNEQDDDAIVAQGDDNPTVLDSDATWHNDEEEPGNDDSTVATNDRDGDDMSVIASRQPDTSATWTTRNMQPNPSTTFSSSLQQTTVLTSDTYNLLNDAITRSKDFGGLNFKEIVPHSSTMISHNLDIATEEIQKLMYYVNEYFNSTTLKSKGKISVAESICFAIAVLTIKVMTGDKCKYEQEARRLLVGAIHHTNLVDEIAYSTIAKFILDAVIKADTAQHLAKEMTGYMKIPLSTHMKYICHSFPEINKHVANEMSHAYEPGSTKTKKSRRQSSLWTHPGCRNWLLRNFGVYSRMTQKERRLKKVSLTNVDYVDKKGSLTNVDYVDVVSNVPAAELAENGENTNPETTDPTDPHKLNVANAMVEASEINKAVQAKVIEEAATTKQSVKKTVDVPEATKQKRITNARVDASKTNKATQAKAATTKQSVKKPVDVPEATKQKEVSKFFSVHKGKAEHSTSESKKQLLTPPPEKNHSRTIVDVKSIDELYIGDKVLISNHRKAEYINLEGEVTKFVRGHVIVKSDKLEFEVRCKATDIKLIE